MHSPEVSWTVCTADLLDITKLCMTLSLSVTSLIIKETSATISLVDAFWLMVENGDMKMVTT
jgi:hypothetical protein